MPILRRHFACGALLLGLCASLWSETTAAQSSLPEPFDLTLKARRPSLPEPFALTLRARRPSLPEPIELTLKARRPGLPEPIELTLRARQPSLPEPIELTLRARRPSLPEPIELTLKARRPGLPEPFELTLKASRPILPEPFTLTLKARRSILPEPFTLTLKARRVAPARAAGSLREGSFRLSGGIDAKMKAALEDKVSKTGARLLLDGSNMAFTFVAIPSDAGGPKGSLEMSPRSITHTWQFTYKNKMVDRRDTTCLLKKGHYNILSPDEPMKMVGGWGGALTCRTIVSRDGKVTSDTSADTVMMINYDKAAREWIVNVVGVQDGQWRLR